jgi:transposase
MSEPILSEQLWQRIEPLLPKQKKRRHVQYAGRKPVEARKVMTGIIFVLKTGVPWKSLPATSDFPSGQTCRRRLLEWDRRASGKGYGKASSLSFSPKVNSIGSGAWLTVPV